MNRSFLFALCIGFVCRFSLPINAQEKPGNFTKIEVFASGESVGAASFPAARVQIAATKITRDAATGRVTLKGDCAVRIIQDEEHSLRFKGDSATVEASEIEVQVDGGYGTAVPDFPYRQLYKALKSAPGLSLFRLHWGFSMGSFATDGTALYDRRTQELKTYEARSFSSPTFTGVTEEMFLQEALRAKEWHATSGFTGPLGWHGLTKYGAVEQLSSGAAHH